MALNNEEALSLCENDSEYERQYEVLFEENEAASLEESLIEHDIEINMLAVDLKKIQNTDQPQKHNSPIDIPPMKELSPQKAVTLDDDAQLAAQ